MQKITPCLWFPGNAAKAVRFYKSVFKDARIDAVTRYGDEGPGPAGSVLTIAFRLNGQRFLALNGVPEFKFTPAVSFVVNCKTQADIDFYWKKLSKGGQIVQCGWLTDRFGLSWQVVPTALEKMLTDKDARKAERVISAIMGMKKLDLARLRRAHEGRP